MAKRSSSNFSNPRKRIPSISFGVVQCIHGFSAYCLNKLPTLGTSASF